jgi:ankyrin repeat protein
MAVGYAHTLLGDFHLAEEAAEDAFLQTNRDLSRLDEPAACYGHIDVARLLLEYGADPNATYEYNRHDPNEDFIEIGAPLWFAVEKDDHALAELLIESGAEVNTRLHAWYPATLNADGYPSEKMLNPLYRHGAT